VQCCAGAFPFSLWLKELQQWFDDGPESEAILLIKGHTTAISHWTKNDAGELRL
jgi:general stress protein 26